MKRNKFTKIICIILIMSMLIILPKDIQAAQETGWNVYTDGKKDKLLNSKVLKSCTIEVEVGRTVYLDTCFVASNMSKVRYKSSKKSVATVNKKTGVVKTKKKGTTTITATYKGKSYKCTLKVLKKGKLKSTTTYKNLNKSADALAKYYGKKITTKNFESIAAKAYEYNSYSINKLYSGYVKTKKVNRLAAPSVIRADEMVMEAYSYAYGIEPLINNKITLVSATPKVGATSIKASINKKPTLTDIYAINMVSSVTENKKMPKIATVLGDVFFVKNVISEETGESYVEYGDFLYTRCVLKQGSTEVEIKLYTDRNCKKPYTVKEGDNFMLNLSVWTDNTIQVAAK